jgi:hypothetical protein
MPLNVRGAVGWAGRAGLGAVAVVIAGSVVLGPCSAFVFPDSGGRGHSGKPMPVA